MIDVDRQTYTVYDGTREIKSFKAPNNRIAVLWGMMIFGTPESPAECIWNEQQKCWYIHCMQEPYERKTVLRMDKSKPKK